LRHLKQEKAMEMFRSLPRPAQVLELESAKAIGIGIFKHYVAHYYHYADYYVALCSTKCGIDFTQVFDDGHAHADMLEAISLNGLPRAVKRSTRAEANKARLMDEVEATARRPKESFEESYARTAAIGLHANYAAAKERGCHMEYFRSLSDQHQAFMLLTIPSIGGGDHKHYHAHYAQLDDFFIASCTTPDGTDFHLVFRDGRPYADMLKAGVLDRTE
jgi:hypothetical protein